MKVLIICNPEDGNATELCLFLKLEAERMNRKVVLVNPSDLSKEPTSFDAIVVGATLEITQFSKSITRYLNTYRHVLNNIPLFFLSLTQPENVEIAATDETASHFLHSVGIFPQLILQVSAGTVLMNNHYVTNTDWPRLKIAMQQFMIRNDLMMSGAH